MGTTGSARGLIHANPQACMNVELLGLHYFAIKQRPEDYEF